MTRWSGAQPAPTVTRKPCRYGCGGQVDTFVDKIGLRRQLEPDPVPINWDLHHSSIRRRLWEYRGGRVGWVQLWRLERGWRPLRLAHQCGHTPKREHESKRKHKKENTP